MVFDDTTRGVPKYGQAKINRNARAIQVVDDPTENQLSSNVLKCIGVNNIDNMAVFYDKKNLWYRPNRAGYVVPAGINGTALGESNPYVFW